MAAPGERTGRRTGSEGARRRSPLEWGIRVVLAVIAALLALPALSDAAARILAKTDAEQAHRLAPWDGQIAARLAEQRLTRSFGDAAGSTQLARAALRQDPTAVDAASVLGLQAQLAGDEEAADRLFAYAHALSRRERRAQLWAIEEAVNRGDIAGALRHYDTALRTSRSASTLLYPVLATAIAEPLVRAALMEKLTEKPVWIRSFINHLAVNVADPEATVQVLREGDRLGLPIEEAERVAVVNAVAGRGLHDLAWSYYASFRDGADRRRSRDPTFLRPADDAAIFDWMPSNEGGLIASFQSGEDGGVVAFSVPSGTGGTLLRQTQLLPPGTYRLDGTGSQMDIPADAPPYWSLTCQDGRELGRVAITADEEGGARFSQRIIVPAGCPVQTLSLIARSSSQVAGQSGQIDRVLLSPAGGERS